MTVGMMNLRMEVRSDSRLMCLLKSDNAIALYFPPAFAQLESCELLHYIGSVQRTQ